MTTLDLPIINLEPYLHDPNSPESLRECEKAALTMLNYSLLAIKDPRASEQDNSHFLNLLEDYFNQDVELLKGDIKPELGYQVGATPENTELPRCGRDDRCKEKVNQLTEDNKPLDFNNADPKWRFFWRIGDTPPETKYKQLNADPVIPPAFPNWSQDMNQWGYKLHSAVEILSEMLAIGLGLSKDTFTKLTKNGPHLLAPTASDLVKYGQVGKTLAGFHYDLNFLTIHGKSRFPGLRVWTKTGNRLDVAIPNGCLLVQSGKQMEWLTGGKIEAGYHEVIVNEKTIEAMTRQKENNRPQWRISSTLFYHIASDQKLYPIGDFNNEKSIIEYPEIDTGFQVQQELGLINLL